MDSSNVFIIIPVYNEAAVIGQTLHEVLKTGHSIVVVDDGSTDGTGVVVRAFPVYYIHQPVSIGQGGALHAGMDFAKQREAIAAVHFDEDGQHRASNISQLLQRVLEGVCDIVFGSRFLQQSTQNIPLSV